MSIEKPYITPTINPPVKLDVRTSQLYIDTANPKDYGYTASRQIKYLDANGQEVPAPAGAETSYQFGERITPELMAAEPDLAATIAWIAAFIDRRDPKK